MNGKDLFTALQELDDRIVTEAAFYPAHRPVRFSKRIAVILAAALLLTACAAYVAVEWDTLFADKFHPSEAVLEQAKDGVQQVAAITECDGYTFAVRQTLGDDRTIHIALDITFPESVPLAERLTRNQDGEWDPSIMPDSISFYHGRTEQSEIQGMDKDALNKFFKGRRLSSGSSSGTSFERADLDSNTISCLIYYSTNESMAEQEDPYITMVIQDIRQITQEPGRGTLIAQGPFAISWPRTNSGIVHELEITDQDKRLGKVTLSGFFLCVEWFEIPETEIKRLTDSVRIILKDGTSFGGQVGSGSSYSSRDGVVYGLKMNWTFREILLLDEVASVQAGEYTVKVP